MSTHIGPYSTDGHIGWTSPAENHAAVQVIRNLVDSPARPLLIDYVTVRHLIGVVEVLAFNEGINVYRDDIDEADRRQVEIAQAIDKVIEYLVTCMTRA